MIVAVGTMGIVKVPTYQIINMVPMRCAFVPAIGAVNMFLTVPFAFVAGRAAVWVGATYGNGVLIDVGAVRVMQVTIMEIVRVPLVTYRHVPAVRIVRVTVL